ncbi:efflux RND transporter periplasmic adaptor subunit [Tateyamaria sp. syn59]|uniref:efflux RND transporter periplasmic adaptor subunit n=1 Tax=Tateyamaria sp. syn59 TaxID=2576942 RepID=UPI00167384FB|nr:efflux RND transporter periplasmic adaptor subunit [Tateyamaria sp. syn59]
MAFALILPAALAAEPVSEAEPIFVQTAIVPSANQSVSRTFFGRIAALETVDISFEVGGYLQILNAREGATVPRGAVLAELARAPFERAVERAELNLQQAERDLDRAQTLAARNVASAVRAENAETARDLADVALREARDALSDARITAPFDALIADRLGTPFTTIEPGVPLLRLHNMSEIRVEFDIPERLFGTIKDPTHVTFTGQIAGQSDPVPLIFREFRAETGRVGQSYTVSLAADLPQGDVLLPGRAITVKAEVERDLGGIVLPSTAIATRPGGGNVVVAVDQSETGLTARYIDVTVSSRNGTQFAVQGVTAGTEIVEIGAHLIEDGQPLKRFTGLTVEGS